MKLHPWKDSRSALILALIWGMLVYPQHYTWSAAGYPTPETQVVGDETGLETHYDLAVTAPEQVVRGESFEVRLSFAHSDAYFATSTATLLVSNGTVLGDSEISLTPENAWQVSSRDIGTVGLTIRVTTQYSAQANSALPQVTYVDSLTKRVTAVASTGANAPTVVQAPVAAKKTAWGWWIASALVIVGGIALANWYVRRRRAH